MLVLNDQLCNKLLGHIPILSPGGGCLGHCLEQECKAVTGLDGIGDLLVMSAIGTGGRFGVICAVPCLFLENCILNIAGLDFV